jgi:hypothetical protein
MIYFFEYDGLTGGVPSRPRWVKVITDTEGVDQKTILNFENKEELEQLTVVEIYTHVQNLIQYIKDTANGISAVDVDEQIPLDGWHFKGNWGEIEWAKDESFKWWNYAYYKDEEEPA